MKEQIHSKLISGNQDLFSPKQLVQKISWVLTMAGLVVTKLCKQEEEKVSVQSCSPAASLPPLSSVKLPSETLVHHTLLESCLFVGHP